MHAVGIDGNRHVNAVVDEKPGAVLLRNAPKLPGQLEQFPDRQVLFPELHCPHSAFERGAHSLRQGDLCRMPVSDEVELEINCQGSLRREHTTNSSGLKNGYGNEARFGVRFRLTIRAS